MLNIARACVTPKQKGINVSNDVFIRRNGDAHQHVADQDLFSSGFGLTNAEISRQQNKEVKQGDTLKRFHLARAAYVSDLRLI